MVNFGVDALGFFQQLACVARKLRVSLSRSGGGVVSGNVFVPKTAENYTYDLDGGSVGFYPGTGPNPLYPGGIGEIHSPDDHVGDTNKNCINVPLGGATTKTSFKSALQVKRMKRLPGTVSLGAAIGLTL
jgi:hypothetical protein